MTKLQRVRGIYGPGNRIPVGKTSFFENYVHNEKGEAEQFVPGTKVRRLRLVKIGVRAVAAFDDEIDALLEGLRDERDNPMPKPGGLRDERDKAHHPMPKPGRRPRSGIPR